MDPDWPNHICKSKSEPRPKPKLRSLESVIFNCDSIKQSAVTLSKAAEAIGVLWEAGILTSDENESLHMSLQARIETFNRELDVAFPR